MIAFFAWNGIFASLASALIAVGLGFAMLAGGGEILVAGAIRLARRLGMTPLLIGLTVVAFGTSMPELFISVTASLQGHPDIMLGNVIGSNIANVGLILGLCALLSPLHMHLREVATELLLVIGGSVVLLLLGLRASFPRGVGLLFLFVLAVYTVLIYRSSSNSNSLDPRTPDGQAGSLLPVILMIAAGLLLLSWGSNLFIRGAIHVARHVGISELVIGLTLAAVGTSLPELASSISALRRQEGSLIIGNVIGSNLFNLFMVLGLSGMLRPLFLSGEAVTRDLPVMLGFSLVLLPILERHRGIDRRYGLFLLSAYGAYCFWLL